MSEPKPPAPANTLIPLIDNIFAPEVFASEAQFFAVGAGIVSVTFISYRWDNNQIPAEQRRVVVGRLVMPVQGAQALAVGLYDFLKKNNLDPAPPPDPSKIQ